jgi:hypothetical protein
MRALARIRTLAAMCALLSFLTASVLAGVPGRPIDRPEGPPEPTTEVGDPDQPPSIVVVLGTKFLILRIPRMLWRVMPKEARHIASKSAIGAAKGPRNAR